MIRIGIDAANFARDRRGMGRVARTIVEATIADPAFVPTLLVTNRRDAAPVERLFEGRATVQPARVAARRSRYDVVWFPWNGMRFSAAAPSVLTINDAFAFTYPAKGIVAKMREQAPIRRGARHASIIVTPSRYSQREIARALPVAAERITVIPYAADPFFSPSQSSRQHSHHYVLMIGARETRKHASLVIEACRTAFGVDDLLIVVGDLAPADRRSLSRAHLRHTVLRNVSDEGLRELYRGARVVAVPSTAEGFGLVAVEAMACGTATIASNTSALPEATQGAALLLDPCDSTAWSDAIGRVLHDDAFAMKLAAQGAARFAFSDRSAFARAYLRLFVDLVDDRAQPFDKTLR
ncbi:MAG: glycosyltransferase family 4 protein [Candidatus Eremiobacteraeota bacterium]|nr:glycosyltransferase family 4 protein [Candidatus Eremiobacteraeota bacterium]MBV9647597.1 glycosyltransferase family 4 protein [Candidatus Eremiobacteraeota bacterium]